MCLFGNIECEVPYMLIQVHYPDNRFDYVKDDVLQGLIESREIKGFRRSSGWVTLGVSPLRQSRRNPDFKQMPEVKKIIQVEYSDYRYDYIPSNMLESLIDSNKVVKFRRKTGWATVGLDSLRMSAREQNDSHPDEMKRRAL
jgi:hypothetical protein